MLEHFTPLILICISRPLVEYALKRPLILIATDITIQSRDYIEDADPPRHPSLIIELSQTIWYQQLCPVET